MANFQPMKQRFLLLLEDNLRLLGIRGRFLDYGCGSADVSRYLVERCRMPGGAAFDLALDDDEIDRRRQGLPELAHTNTTENLDAPFDLAVLFDVIEHVPDAPAVLRDLHRLVRDDGWLFLTVPYNRCEWGIDDHFYGHLRRLSRRGVITLLESNGWDVLRTLDPTFPSFWLIRRLYLLAAAVSPRIRARHQAAGSDLDRTFASSRQSAWESMGPIPRLLSSVLVPWKLIRLFDLYFESVYLGFELFVVAQKRAGSNDCEVCRHGAYTHHRFFDRYARQICSYCRSELLLPRLPAAAERPAKRPSALVRRLQRLLRVPRARRLARLEPPARSLLDVGRRDPDLLDRLAAAGWRTRSAGPEEIAASESCGMATLFHVVEHSGDLRATLDRAGAALLPNGYLVLEYPNARSLLKRLLGSRWFGFDPPHHRLQVDPVILADYLGLHAFRLVRESHLSLEYSYFLFAQSLANALLPFHRDGVYRLLASRPTTVREKLGALLSLPVFAASAVLFLVYQPLAALLKRGCVVLQVFQKSDLG